MDPKHCVITGLQCMYLLDWALEWEVCPMAQKLVLKIMYAFTVIEEY